MDSLLQCIVKEITWPYTTLSVVALDSNYYPGPIPKGLREIETLHYVRNLIV